MSNAAPGPGGAAGRPSLGGAAPALTPGPSLPALQPSGGLEARFDLVVIGGGCNGTGVARDAALRGLKVLLVEKGDLGGGATGASSGMIHGGLRYLLQDPDVTRLACLDSGYIQRIAPHLLFRIPFLMPVPAQRPMAQGYLTLVDAFLAAYDKYQPLKNGLPHLRLEAHELHHVYPGLAQPMAGAGVFDEWGIDPWRLVACNALSAHEAGAEVRLGWRVEALLGDETGRVVGLRLCEERSGRREDLGCRVVLNAAGAWAPQVARLAGQDLRLRPGKGVHVVFGRRVSNYALVVQAVDGRDVFLMPHEQSTWIGTTDDDYFGDPDDVEVLADDVDYLVSAVARALPMVRDLPIVDAFVGLRPTLFAWGPTEDALSRNHALVDHAATGAPGLLSLVGGKLASYRIMAEETVDAICALLGQRLPCRSHREPLPGAEATVDLGDLAAVAPGLPRLALLRLVQRQGCRAWEVLQGWRGPHEMVCACNMVTAAELRYVIQHEWARDLAALRHRTGLGRGPCGGARCAARAAAVLARELGLPPQELAALLQTDEQERWARVRPALRGPSAPRVALARMLRCAGRGLPGEG